MELGYSPLFLLGLVAGFNFIKEWEATRYQLARQDGHKLYFRAAFWGLLVTLITALFVFTVSSSVNLATQGRFELPFADTSSFVILTLLLSPVTAFLIAIVFNQFTNALEYYIDALADNEFEHLLVTAMENDFMVMATMEDNKVYVGWVFKVSDPAKEERKYFSIIPVVTGFRNETRKVIFTTFYDQLYISTNESLSHLDTDHFATVLPAHRLVSCRLFDPAAYSEFQGLDSDILDKPPSNLKGTALDVE